MDTSEQKRLVMAYVEAYNRFDVEAMLAPLHDDVEFSNCSNGKVNLETKGKENFRQQAEQALPYFSQREQRITNWTAADNQLEFTIDFTGVAAIVFPNGLKLGDTLRLQGKSIFQFRDGRISSIEDIS